VLVGIGGSSLGFWIAGALECRQVERDQCRHREASARLRGTAARQDAPDPAVRCRQRTLSRGSARIRICPRQRIHAPRLAAAGRCLPCAAHIPARSGSHHGCTPSADCARPAPARLGGSAPVADPYPAHQGGQAVTR
jgi:hypothetical protein